MELMHTVENYCSIPCNKLLNQLQQDILKQNRNMINTVGFSSLYCLPVCYKKGTDELFISSSAFIQLFWDNLCHSQNSKTDVFLPYSMHGYITAWLLNMLQIRKGNIHFMVSFL